LVCERFVTYHKINFLYWLSELIQNYLPNKTNKMDKPTIAGKTPIAVQLEAGKTYAWCSCGNSTNQPFCNGSHKGSSFVPKVFVAEETKTAYMCNCKHTANPGFCDGAHKAL